MRIARPDLRGAPGSLADALAQVRAVPGAPAAAVRDEMLRFAAVNPDALERTCSPGHFTGSALVVAAEMDRFLLLHHAKLRRWLQPGGHADGDGDLARVAWREATEETGIGDLAVLVPAVDLDVHRVDPPGEPAHLHYDVRFVVLAPPGARVQANHESSAHRWVAAPELGGLGVDPGLVRLARAGLAAARDRRR